VSGGPRRLDPHDLAPADLMETLMANQPRPGNEARAVRVEQELWDAAKARASERSETVSGVIRRALQRYARADTPSGKPRS
jgi:hypothetical protein